MILIEMICDLAREDKNVEALSLSCPPRLVERATEQDPTHGARQLAAHPHKPNNQPLCIQTLHTVQSTVS